MQNRYTGDIGDFSKLGLLRALRAAGFSIGLNWYLTPDETHNGDGRHVDYLKQEKYRACDEDLWLGLGAIVEAGEREVRLMENDSILQATFFSECLDFSVADERGERKCMPKAERTAFRAEWFARSLVAMAGSDIVCVDPDNGLVVPSSAGRPKENKYVLPQELAGYYAQGSTVVCYQHKARRKDPFYIQQFDALLASGAFPGASGLALKFRTTSQRYYLLIVQPRHAKAVSQVVDGFLASPWGEHFCLL